MKSLLIILIPALALALPFAAAADDVAAERARLANQRIQAEDERRAREEEERLKQAQAEVAVAVQAEPAVQVQAEPAPVVQPMEQSAPTASREVATATASDPVDRIEMSRALEQLRELGALKDAGYLTDEEFQLLKKKILDGAL